METLLIKFLNRNFTVIFDGEIRIFDINSGEKILYEKMMGLIIKIFSVDFINTLGGRVINQWFKDKSSEFVGGLNKFLDECVIELGPTNWVVRHKLFGEINLNDVDTYPIDSPMKSYKDAVKTYVNSWYDDEIIRVSEKIMGIDENFW